MPTGLPTWRHTWSTFPIWKLRQDVHRQADHAQIIVQELFASGVVGRVSLDANRLADLAPHLVNLSDLETAARCPSAGRSCPNNRAGTLRQWRGRACKS